METLNEILDSAISFGKKRVGRFRHPSTSSDVVVTLSCSAAEMLPPYLVVCFNDEIDIGNQFEGTVLDDVIHGDRSRISEYLAQYEISWAPEGSLLERDWLGAFPTSSKGNDFWSELCGAVAKKLRILRGNIHWQNKRD
jgi:hypothetical protein